MIIDCRAGGGVATFPSVPGLIRNHRGLGAVAEHTYGITMEAQVAHEITELFALQRCASKDGIKFMQAWEGT